MVVVALFKQKSVEMITQLFLISFVLVLVTTYLMRSAVSVADETPADFPSEKLPAASPIKRSQDFGLWGTLRIAWKLRTVFWNGTQSYEAVQTLLQHYSSTFARVLFITNWKSAGRIVVCSHLETVKQVLRSSIWLNRVEDDHYIYLASFGKPLGILLGNGPYWKTARRIVLKGFRDHGFLDVSHVEEIFSQEIHMALNDLRERLEDSTTDYAIFSPSHVIQQTALNAVFKMIFSRKPSQEDPLEKNLAEMLNYNNDNLNVGLSAFDFFPFLKYFPKILPSARENIRACHAIYDIVSNERERRVKGGLTYRDLLDSFLYEVEAHEGSNPNYFTYESVQTTIRDLIAAGSDTIHVTLEHFILFMASNREEQKKVQNEIDRVIGPHGFPTYEHRKSMICTQAAIQETWRLSSLLPATIRTNSEDCQLGGMTLKKGTYMAPLYIGVHHSEELWGDPMIFKPSRFLSECGRQIVNTEKTLPFSYGPRACPGELSGRVAVFLFTVALLREFEWELSDLHPPPLSKFHGCLTRAPVEYFVKFRRRQNLV